MWYVKPEYSRSKVDKAGKIFVEPDSYTHSEIADAISVLTNWRASHAYPVNTFQATLRYRLRSMGIRALVAQRLKRTPSIVAKLGREGGMRLSRMQDIGGLRAVVDSIPHVREIEKQYRAATFAHELVDWDDYIDSPKFDGYRSVHLVYKYKNTRIHEFDNLRIELQLRTRYQHAWATAVETMGTYLGMALKSGEGDDSWRLFFRISANALAHVEKAPPVPGFESLDRAESLLLLRDIESEISVLDHLKGYSIATDHITSGGRGEFHVVVLDSRSKTVSIRSYPEDQFDLATEDYAAVEAAPGYGDGVEAVLVSVSSIRALKTAYPNYFLDTHEFVHQIDKLISEARRNSGGRNGDVRASDDGKSLRNCAKQDVFVANERLSGNEIPQAENFDSIRAVLAAIKEGKYTSEEISAFTKVSLRHTNYRIAAAKILGCIASVGIELTPAGLTWLRRVQGTIEEAEFLRSLIEQTKVFLLIVPDLFENPGPSRAAIAKRLLDTTDLAASTADRRAATLLVWASKLKQGRLMVR